jgi:phosphoenolpyruvate carboxykinase (ATP)
MNNINFNLSVSELYQHAIKYEGLQISSTGALLAYSGKKMGRSPKDKRIVYDDNTKDIWWGQVNMPIKPELFKYYKECCIKHLNKKNRLYQVDAYGGWDPENRVKVRIYCSEAYHALFMMNMLIPTDKPFDNVDFTIYNAGDQDLNNFTNLIYDLSLIDYSLDDVLVALNFTSREAIIIGTRYAGEMKKSILTLMMYLMPIKGHLSMHASCNVRYDNLTLFFGMSGCGKTTLSTDDTRILIGDDEHVWTDKGVFNVEGGCYAKCIKLSKEAEPNIFNAIKYGSVLENVTHDKKNVVDYNDCSLTKNTRCSYPLSHINAMIPASKDIHPTNIIFLSCDAFGLLPPVAKLNPEQAINFFVNGYTAKVGGTEIGITEPQATFSSCFGEPFLIWHPNKYGQLLKEKMEKHNVNVWLLNTGWIKGCYGVGHRISIKDTRTLLNSIHDGSLNKVEYEEFPIFKFMIPKECPNVDPLILNPIKQWTDKKLYMEKLTGLYSKFQLNYKEKLSI